MKLTQSGTFKYTLAFALIGIIVSVLIAYVQRNTIAVYDRNLPYISLGDHVKNKSTKAHLWFEELMAGDETLNFNKDVLSLFISSKEILEGAYNAKGTELGKFERLNDEETDLILKEAIGDIENLTNAARQRYDFKKQAGANVETDSLANVVMSSTGEAAGGKLDQEFDATYEEFQETMDRLIVHISERVDEDSGFLNSLSWVTIFFVIVAFVFICALTYKTFQINEKLIADNNVKLSEETARMEAIAGFIEGVSSGNYNIQLAGMSETQGLGETLVTMRNKLSLNAETDRRRNWSTTGLAQVGDILRSGNTSTAELYDNIIRFVVKYTESNQGGLFVFNEENEADQYLELVACYAFERKKYLTRKIGIGEGLVGQCFVEGEKIYLLDVPEEYITITSGLGGANPTALLLVPMKVNEKLYGVIEIASFKKYEDYEIELVEKLAESIASTIATVRTNESTRVLLEKTQQQTEELRAQEEEMRQNMEELQATQEEMFRKQNQSENVLKVVDSSFALIDFNPNGVIIDANANFLNLMGYTIEEIKNRHHQIFVDSATKDSSDYKNFWKELSEGKEIKGEFKRFTKNGDVVWIAGNYTPVFNQSGQLVSVKKMAYDITTIKEQKEFLLERMSRLEYVLNNSSELSLSNQDQKNEMLKIIVQANTELAHKKMRYTRITQIDSPLTNSKSDSQD